MSLTNEDRKLLTQLHLEKTSKITSLTSTDSGMI